MLFGLNWVAPHLIRERRNCLSILIYHRVLEAPDYLRPNEPTAADFDWQMALIARHFNPLPLSEAVDRLRAGTLPPRAVCVTFDDGYADNLEVAGPILTKWGVPATLYVATGFLNGGMMWNDTIIETVRMASGDSIDCCDLGLGLLPIRLASDKCAALEKIITAVKHLPPDQRQSQVDKLCGERANLPTDLMLTDQQLKTAAHSIFEIGAHTVSHPILVSLSDGEAEQEIAKGRDYLQRLLGTPITQFAYPHGRYGIDFDDRHANMVRTMGFSAAVATDHGVNFETSDYFQLKRFTPWDKSAVKFYLRLLLSRK